MKTFFNQFECNRRLSLYASGTISLEKAIEGANSAIAGYLIGNKDKPEKLDNFIACRDYLQDTRPSSNEVAELLKK